MTYQDGGGTVRHEDVAVDGQDSVVGAAGRGGAGAGRDLERDRKRVGEAGA